MFHTFDTEVAELFHDANVATVFQNLCYWIAHNRTNDKNRKNIEINGVVVPRYFTFNSIQAFLKQFTYYSKKQVETYLAKLKERGLIVKANFNEKGFDRTSWYCLVDEEYWMKKYLGSGYDPQPGDAAPIPPSTPEMTPSASTSNFSSSDKNELPLETHESEEPHADSSNTDLIDEENLQTFHFPKTGNGFPQTEKWISPKREMDFPKTGNGFPQTEKPIPDINTHLKPHNKQNPASADSVLRFFESLDPAFIFDTEFYSAAAGFLNSQELGEEYASWLYHTLRKSPGIKNLRGYYYRVFYRDVYVKRFLAEKALQAAPVEAPEQKTYVCPVCGESQTISPGIDDCIQCRTPVHPEPHVLERCKKLYAMDDATKETYNAARSRIFCAGGNVSKNLADLDKQFGIVS